MALAIEEQHGKTYVKKQKVDVEINRWRNAFVSKYAVNPKWFQGYYMQ